MELAADPKKGMRRWLLVRRSIDDPEDRWPSTRHTAQEGPLWRN
jgi:hypothetical protein